MRAGPGLWVDDQRWRGEELVGERPGAVLSSQITHRECRPGRTPGTRHGPVRQRECQSSSPESKSCSLCLRSGCRSRESSAVGLAGITGYGGTLLMISQETAR
jgi:hypothetical protein